MGETLSKPSGPTYPITYAPGASREASWLALDLKKKGFYVIAADWKKNEFMEVPEFCDEFHLCDLRLQANCLKVVDGCRDVYNLAADMGGMGFIKSNESVLMYNNTMISFNVLEAARCKGVKRYFYSSSVRLQRRPAARPDNPGLKEAGAWPAKPQDTYGLEKLADAKAPAAFCRKAVCATSEFEMWGDGKQTRSFMFIDDCVEGIQKIMDSDCEQPLNLGSDEMIDMNDFAKLALSFESKELPIKHIPGPEGVRGRNSDNTMIKEKLGWAPSIPVAVGLKKTYFWIKDMVEKDKAAGIDTAKLGVSEIVVQKTDELDAREERRGTAAPPGREHARRGSPRRAPAPHLTRRPPFSTTRRPSERRRRRDVGRVVAAAPRGRFFAVEPARDGEAAVPGDDGRDHVPVRVVADGEDEERVELRVANGDGIDEDEVAAALRRPVAREVEHEREAPPRTRRSGAV
ncbi:UDP-glucuronate decarboxylase [Aureococcus anophagefferens]|nr:UDP-glucuronate decarboxylase [Aureococcus anophagefferens]